LDEVAGIDGARIRGVEVGGVTCLVSDVDLDEFGEEPLRKNLERIDWLERVAREHDAVIKAVARIVAVLPLRLATVYWDDASASAEVTRHHDAVCAALDRVDGRDEWGVKVYRMPVDEAPEQTSRATSGAEYLRRRRAQVAQQTSDRGADDELAARIFDEFAAVADDSRRHRPQDPSLTGRRQPMLLNAAFLVARCDEDRFRAAVSALADERPPGAVELTGPWPPYSFAEWTGS
jgi:hypothetical protein